MKVCSEGALELAGASGVVAIGATPLPPLGSCAIEMPSSRTQGPSVSAIVGDCVVSHGWRIDLREGRAGKTPGEFGVENKLVLYGEMLGCCCW